MKAIATVLVALLLFGCAHVQPLSAVDVLALCEAEYENVERRMEGNPSHVYFDVVPGGELLPRSEYLQKKAESEASVPAGFIEYFLSVGSEFPAIGARAETSVWTDSEYIVFTTSDERYDVRATLFYDEERIPFDLKEMATRISDRYDRGEKLQQSNADDSEYPAKSNAFETQ